MACIHDFVLNFLLKEILHALEISTAIQYLPQLWSDLVIFDLANRENLLALVLNIMSNYYPASSADVDIPESTKLSEEFTTIAWKIWNIIEGQDKDRIKQIGWTGKMLGDVISLQIRGDKFDNACAVIKKLVASPMDVLGVPELKDLKLFLDAAISQNSGAMCLVSLLLLLELDSLVFGTR
jgi:pentatricopeptide repeat domain-containing protein 3